jgi:hypothetical protein
MFPAPHDRRVWCVEEGMVLDGREPKGGCFLNESRIEFCAVEGHAGLGHGGLQRAQPPHADQPTRLLHDAAVDIQHFANREVAHSGKPLIKFGVLVQHVFNGLTEVLFRTRVIVIILTSDHKFTCCAQKAPV